MSNESQKEESIIKYQLADKLEGAGYDKNDLASEASKKNALSPIEEIFGKMTPEQILCYAINLYYRHKITQNTDWNPDTSNIQPPKTGEAAVLAQGLKIWFPKKQETVYPDIVRIHESLDQISIGAGTIQDEYYNLMGVAARHVFDHRGAHWMMSSNSRIAAGRREVAQCHPQIWMILQDSVIHYLSPPQLADLYYSPLSPKNPGEKMRKNSGKHGGIKRLALNKTLALLNKDPQTVDYAHKEAVKETFRQSVATYKQKIKEAQQAKAFKEQHQ